jgi:hypothetical protein
MSLRLLLGSLQSGPRWDGKNELLVVVHGLVEELAAIEKREDLEVGGLKEMILRVEERSMGRVEMVERELRAEIDVLAKAMEVGGLTAGHLGVGMS